jgi:hypothetical protein
LSGERSRKGYLPPNPIEKSPYREKQGLQSTGCLGMLSGIWENSARLLALVMFSGLQFAILEPYLGSKRSKTSIQCSKTNIIGILFVHA